MSIMGMEGRRAGRDLIFFGVVTIILGLAAIASPVISGLSVALVVGGLLVLGGILRLLLSFDAASGTEGILEAALGALMLLCGVALVAQPLFSFAVLTLIIAAYLFADGIAEVVAAFRGPSHGIRGRLLFSGVVSIALGAMMWSQYPLAGVVAIAVVLGVKLVAAGTMMIAGGSAARALATHTLVEA